MAEGCKDPSFYKDCFKVHVECLRYLTVPSLAVAPSFDILVTSAGVNYPTVDTGDPALWLLYTLLIAPWARAPWEHHLLSNICRLSIFSSQKSPSACARSLPPPQGDAYHLMDKNPANSTFFTATSSALILGGGHIC